MGGCRSFRTFEELAAIGLARGDFEGDDVALQQLEKKLIGVKGERTCASFSSLMGIPIVEVMVVVGVVCRDGWWWFGAWVNFGVEGFGGAEFLRISARHCIQ